MGLYVDSRAFSEILPTLYNTLTLLPGIAYVTTHSDRVNVILPLLLLLLLFSSLPFSLVCLKNCRWVGQSDELSINLHGIFWECIFWLELPNFAWFESKLIIEVASHMWKQRGKDLNITIPLHLLRFCLTEFDRKDLCSYYYYFLLSKTRTLIATITSLISTSVSDCVNTLLTFNFFFVCFRNISSWF